MDDLASVVGSVLKKPQKEDLRTLAALSPTEQAKSDSFEKSPANLRELQSAIDAEKNPENKKILMAELDKQSAPFADLGSVIGAAVAEKSDKVETKTTEPREIQKPKEEVSALASFGAGAGKAVGMGVMGLQQLAGKGTGYFGELTGVDALKKAGSWLSKDATEGAKKLTAENAPYEEANPKTNLGGEVAGMVLSPINKLVPGLGAPASTVVGAGFKGAAQGSILNTLTAPVLDDSKPFLLEKAKQAVVGGIGGTLGAGLAQGLSKGLNAGIDSLKGAVGKLGNKEAGADAVVEKALSDLGLKKDNVTPELFDGLKSQVQQAVKTGSLDEKALVRLTEAQTLPVPVPLLQGNVTRDPMQYAKELNLRGINGVGEPIQAGMAARNKALIENLDALGANKGADVVSAGKNLIEPLVNLDKQAKEGVSAAYKAFRDATGKDLDVPLQGLAQDYAKISKSFEGSIPAGVKNSFEQYGLSGGKQLKTFSIEDAEKLIRNINDHYSPALKATDPGKANALDQLRQAVQKSIEDGAGRSAEGGPAMKLALAARRAARERFALIDSTPALKDAIRGVEPDKFIQKNILQGNEAEIDSLVKVLKKNDPKALESLQDSVMAHIKERVLNGKSAENGTFSQDKLKGFVENANMSARLAKVLGPEKMGTLKQLNNVAENALVAPVGSAVNSSNTASAVANLIKNEVQGGALNNVLGVTKFVPGLRGASQMGQQAVQSNRAAALIDEAVNPTLGKQTGQTSIKDLTGLGARTGAAYTGSQSRRSNQR